MTALTLHPASSPSATPPTLPRGARYEITARGRCALLAADLAIAERIPDADAPRPAPETRRERMGRLYVAAMCGNDRALGEVLGLLTRYAGGYLVKRFQLDSGTAEEIASDAVTDVLLAGRAGRRIVESAAIGVYVVAAARRRWLNRHRSARRHGGEPVELRAVTDAHVADAGGALSDASVRANRGEVDAFSDTRSDADRPPSTADRIAERITARLPAVDVLLLTWLGAGIPQSTAADWLGIGYAAARKRTQRLRTRCQEIAGGVS